MTTTQTATARFDGSHSHSLDGVTGYDVIRTIYSPDDGVSVEVVSVEYLPANYSEALDAARKLRVFDDGREQQWGLVTCRYECGCRTAVTHASTPEQFTDLVDLIDAR